MLMDVWEWTPLIALIVLAGLSVVPQPVIGGRRASTARPTGSGCATSSSR